MAIPSEQSGLSQLHVACLNGDFEKVVVAVQTRPETLDLTTVDGATPLMLASLMSHYDIVQFLVVVKSAKISKSNSRNQMKAVDYARDDDVTKLMRAEYIAAGFKENALAASKRQEILGLLESPARRSILKNQHSRGGDFKYHEYKLAKIGTKIGVYGLVGVVETGMPLTRNKTIGMIMPMGDDLPTLSLFSFADHAENAAAPGPTIYATSGWKTDERRAPQVVDSELWCSVAHLLGAKLVGHKFKTGQRDNGALPPAERHKGRGAACHVEVLLATMYAYSLTEGLVARQPGQTEEDYIKNQLFRLKKIKSLDLGKRRCMVIYIDSYACDSCRSYVAAMGLRTGLFFQIREGCGMGPPLRLGGNRRDVYGDIWPDEDAEDADLEAALRADPALMDGHRYRLERDATASRSPETEQAEHGDTSSSDDDDDDDDDDEESPDAAALFTPPPEGQDVPAVSPANQVAFRDRLSKFASQPPVRRAIPPGARTPRWAPYVVPNPLDFKPFPPTPVLRDPFVDRPSPEPGDGTAAAESSEIDRGEEGRLYSKLQFRLR